MKTEEINPKPIYTYWYIVFQKKKEKIGINTAQNNTGNNTNNLLTHCYQRC